MEDRENESKTELRVDDMNSSRRSRIRRKSETLAPEIFNRPEVQGMMFMFPENGRELVQKGIAHILHENENIDTNSPGFLTKLGDLLRGIIMGKPIPDLPVPEPKISPEISETSESKIPITIQEPEKILDKDENIRNQKETTAPVQEPETNTEKSESSKNIKNVEAPKQEFGSTSDKTEKIENEQNPDHEIPEEYDKDIAYQIDHKKPNHGLAFVLSNFQFESPHVLLEGRPAGLHDSQTMRKIWKEYGFEVMFRNNKGHEDTIKFLGEVEEKWSTGKYDMLVGVVSSHGEEVRVGIKGTDKNEVRHAIFCHDGMKIDTQCDIVDRFNNNNQNQGKPMLYFIQACRSGFLEPSTDHGTEVLVNQYSSVSRITEDRGTDRPDARVIRPPAQNAQPQLSTNQNTSSGQGQGQAHSTTTSQGQSMQNGVQGHLKNTSLDQSSEMQTNQDQGHFRLSAEGQGQSAAVGHSSEVVDQGETDRRPRLPSFSKQEIDIHVDKHIVKTECDDISGKKTIEEETTVTTDTVTTTTSVTPEGDIDVSTKENIEEYSTSEKKVILPGMEASGDNAKTEESTDGSNNKEEISVTPAVCCADSLVMFSSPSGKFAFGSTKKGGWLLQLLNEELENLKNNQGMELQHLLTIISNKMALFYETDTDDAEHTGLKCVPCVCHMLRKDLYLRPVPLQDK